MRDIFFLVYLAALFGIGVKRPFLFVLGYAYIDIVSPQRLSYFLLNAIPVSLLAFVAAFGGWLIFDDKRGSRLSWRQTLMLALLGWCWFTTVNADFPVEALGKWDWVWKAMVFAIFLPLTLRTRLRIEALALAMVLCASSIIITGGIKTALSGGGYGSLNLMVSDNSGLYEGSTISMVAVALIPLILWLSNHGTVFPPDRRVKLFAWALCLACALMPIGTETRTGLLCVLLLGGLVWLRARNRVALGLAGLALAVAAVPFLPSSFTSRMGTLENYQADESASTRVAVWKYTWNQVLDQPQGGGFDAYRSNVLRYTSTKISGPEGNQTLETRVIEDHGRAYHSAYFEVLGEQGFLGFALWAMIHIISLARTERIRRRYARRDDPDAGWISPLALALQQGQLVYLLGALFVGIAYQPFVWMLIALQIGLDGYLVRRERAEGWRPMARRRPSGEGAADPSARPGAAAT